MDSQRCTSGGQRPARFVGQVNHNDTVDSCFLGFFGKPGHAIAMDWIVVTHQDQGRIRHLISEFANQVNAVLEGNSLF